MGKTCTLPTGQSQYQVVGRFVPNEKYGEGHAQCKVYRMKHCVHYADYSRRPNPTATRKSACSFSCFR